MLGPGTSAEPYAEADDGEISRNLPDRQQPTFPPVSTSRSRLQPPPLVCWPIHAEFVSSGRTLEEVVGEQIRPMLKQWLTKPPEMVERLVREEIERVSRWGR